MNDASASCTIPELARALGVAEITVRRWVKAGRIRAVLLFGRYRIPASELDHLVARAKTSGVPETKQA